MAPAVELENQTKHVKQINLWRSCALLPLAALVRVWCATLRYDADEHSRAVMRDAPNPSVFLLWHNRVFVAADIHRRFRSGHPMNALVSASKDGAWLTAFFKWMGIQTVRGSRNFRGTQALRELLKHVKSGKDIAITPDGSKGPIYKLKTGVLMPAKHAGGVVLMTVIFGKSKQLNSWDRFYIPMPFSRVVFKAEKIAFEDIKKAGPNADAQAHFIESRLMSLGDDRLD